MSGVPSDAIRASFWFSDDVRVEWPSWDGSDAYDVWDSTHVRQGAHRIETVAGFSDACESARSQVLDNAREKRRIERDGR